MEFIETYNEYPLDWEELCNSSLDTDFQKTLEKLRSNSQTIEEELIQKTWHPSRFLDWCLDEGEKVQEDEEEDE